MYYIDGKGHKLELRSSRNDLTNHTKSKSHHNLLMASRVDTYTHIHILACPHESDFNGRCNIVFGFIIQQKSSF